MTEETSLVPYGNGQDVTIVDAEALQIVQRREYDERLAIAGLVADTLAESDVITNYHVHQCSENTRRRQKDDLSCFSAFLLDRYHFERSASDLYADADAWRGISHGIVRGFLDWMTEQGYASGTINGRLFTSQLSDNRYFSIYSVGWRKSRKNRISCERVIECGEQLDPLFP